ncbi:MAG: metal ABC transporter permease [Clostridia bacterium]|nr:metal ABC transporter permease [Clostridia bacterium]
MVLIIPVTIAAAIALLMGGKNRKIKGDASLAMLSVGALGLGYLIVNRFSTSGNISGDVCTTLFGSTSILTLSKFDVWLCIIMSVVVIGVFIALYNRIFAVTFDETFTTATGVNASAYNLVIAIVTAVIIVLAMKLVGSLLISALVIFPALSAMRVFKSFQSVVICSAAVSVVCSVVGILASILWSTPVGSTIVAIDIAVFLIFTLIGLTKGNKSFTIKKNAETANQTERIA